MSYDFALFAPMPGCDPLVAYQRYVEAEFERHKVFAENRSLPHDPAEETRNLARNRRWVELLQAINPEFEAAPVDFSALVSAGKISKAEAEWYSRSIDLTSVSQGVEVSLALDGAHVRIAYWHDKDQARRIFGEVWRYLEMLSREAYYLIYDPQRESIVDLSLDLPKTLERYDEGVRYLRKIAPAIIEGREGLQH